MLGPALYDTCLTGAIPKPGKDAIVSYFQQHAEEFEQFLLERAGIGEGYVRWRGEETNKRLVLKITTLGSGPSIVAEREYAMKIETI